MVNKLYRDARFKQETFCILIFQNLKENFMEKFNHGFWLVSKLFNNTEVSK